ncbi:MAG: hypothetical protein WB676_16960 [Bryobacteraceae bacterium]
MTNELSQSDSLASTKKTASEARLRANRENAKKSKGPTSPEGKKRSSLNATRHGILSQVVHLPEEEMKSYDEFTARYVAGLEPVGEPEIQLANACADLQFRLHRLAAAEHNLFSIGHSENGDEWETGHPESHTALAFAETMRRSKDPLNTLSTYESRLSRRFLQTLKQLRQAHRRLVPLCAFLTMVQAERREREAQELEQLFQIACRHPDEIENIEPNQFGFVCSTRDWRLYFKRRAALASTSTHRKRRAA